MYVLLPQCHFLVMVLNWLEHVDPLHLRAHVNHWSSKDVLFLRSEAKNQGNRMFPRRGVIGLHQVAVHRRCCRDFWILELVWVRGVTRRSQSASHGWLVLCTVTFSRLLSRSYDNYHSLGYFYLCLTYRLWVLYSITREHACPNSFLPYIQVVDRIAGSRTSAVWYASLDTHE